jgi:thioredoxin-related protein
MFMKKFLLASVICFALLIKSNAQQALSADAVLNEARSKASKENKKVMVIFHASWCAWCHKMDASLNDPSVKEYFEKNYVITHLTIQESKDKKKLENSGADELNKKWGGDNQGIPFWVILDKHGKILADSQVEPGKNVGCPATAEEVAHFINALSKTSVITSEQIVAVQSIFRKNE